MAEEKQEAQKTLVAFVVGLLIGGMLVWAFSGPTATAPTNVDEDTETEITTSKTNTKSNDSVVAKEEETTMTLPELPVGDGSVVVNNQPASLVVELESVTYPISEGWIGVREYNNDQLGYILGVARFSESQGLIPENIELLRSTSAGSHYAIVIFTEDGDFDFSLAGDVQIDTIFDTFTAQ